MEKETVTYGFGQYLSSTQRVLEKIGAAVSLCMLMYGCSPQQTPVENRGNAEVSAPTSSSQKDQWECDLSTSDWKKSSNEISHCVSREIKQ